MNDGRWGRTLPEPYPDLDLLAGIRFLNGNPKLWPMVRVPVDAADVEHATSVSREQQRSDQERASGRVDRQYGQYKPTLDAGRDGHIGEIAFDRYLRWEGLRRGISYSWAKAVADDGKALPEDSGQDFVIERDGGAEPFEVDIKTRCLRSVDRDALLHAFGFPVKEGEHQVPSNYGYPDFLVGTAYIVSQRVVYLVGALPREKLRQAPHKLVQRDHGDDRSIRKEWWEHRLKLDLFSPIPVWLDDPLVLGLKSRCWQDP